MKAIELADRVQKNWSTIYREQIVSELRRLAAVEAERDALKAELEAEREESKRWLVKAQNERDARKELEAELERIKALEPVAYARFADNGNIRIWARTHAEAIAGNLPEAPPMTALYALGSKT